MREFRGEGKAREEYVVCVCVCKKVSKCKQVSKDVSERVREWTGLNKCTPDFRVSNAQINTHRINHFRNQTGE
jgi:hypothetical protein